MVALTPAREASSDAESFAAFVRTLFAARRKQLGRTLGKARVEAVGIDPARRAETLSMDELEALADSS